MKSRDLFRFVGISSLLLVMVFSDTMAQEARPVRGKDYVPGRLIIAFQVEEGCTSSGFVQCTKALSARESQKLCGFETYIYSVPEGVDEVKAAAMLSKLDVVRYATPDFIYRLPSPAPRDEGFMMPRFPNDPLFPLQWPLHNTGQFDGTPDADIDAPEGWTIDTDATDVVVAVSDTGIDYTHQDLIENLWVNEVELYGFPDVDDDGNSYVDDIYGFDFVHAYYDGMLWWETEDPPNGPFDDLYHGTASAGTIGARTNNSEGVAGVAWRARIMSVKSMNHEGAGYGTWIRNSIYYAVANGARVINCSWISQYPDPYIEDGIIHARNNGVLCIVAAGNAGANIDETPSQFGYPAVFEYENMVAVGATEMDDYLVGMGPKAFTWGSNWGPLSVDVAAPGEHGVTTEPLWKLNGGYRFDWGGTSMAMPHLVGMAALAWSQDLNQTYEEVRDRIFHAVDGKPQLDGYIRTGGRVNLFHLLRPDVGPPAPVTDLIAETFWYDRLTLCWTETAEDGASGYPAARYDLRYSIETVTPLNFEDATPVIGEYQPVQAGLFATSAVTGLNEDTLYHFLMKIVDHHGNEVYSNSTSAFTVAQPVVDDLTVAAEGIGFVDITFTVPIVTGTPTKYHYLGMDLRYASEPITEANFDTATQVIDPPEVGEPGTVMTVRVDPLYPGESYWFAVKLTDSFGLEIPVSNTVEGHPFLPSVITFFDDMESGPGGWSSNPAGAWGRTDESAASGVWSWNTCPYEYYPPDWEGSLVSPSMDLSGLTWAALFYKDRLLWHQGEHAFVELSMDGGNSWFTMKEINSLHHGYHDQWQTFQLNLGYFAGLPDLNVRFRLTSDGNGEREGWYMDDVLMGGEVTPLTEILWEDFEGGAPGWSFGNLWSLGSLEYHSPVHAAHYHSTNSSVVGYLDSEELTFQASNGRLYLTFWHKYVVDPSGGTPRLLVSTDGGSSWTLALNALNLRGDGEWTFRGVDLTEVLGGTADQIKLRFSCRGSSSNQVDWFVDDVRLYIVESP